MRPKWMLPPIEELTELPIGKIAMQLSRLNRYAGAVEFSVLRHSMLVRRLVRNQSNRCQLWALLHDAHECWIGDALKPAKEIVGHAWSDLETLYQSHVMRLADCFPDQHEMQMVDDADKEACRLEMEHLPHCPWSADVDPVEWFSAGPLEFVAAVDSANRRHPSLVMSVPVRCDGGTTRQQTQGAASVSACVQRLHKAEQEEARPRLQELRRKRHASAGPAAGRDRSQSG